MNFTHRCWSALESLMNNDLQANMKTQDSQHDVCSEGQAEAQKTPFQTDVILYDYDSFMHSFVFPCPDNVSDAGHIFIPAVNGVEAAFWAFSKTKEQCRKKMAAHPDSFIFAKCGILS